MKELSVFEAKKMSGVFSTATINGVHYAALSGEAFIVSEDFAEIMYQKGKANLLSPEFTDVITAIIG